MDNGKRRQAIKAKTTTPAEQQLTALAEYPCILTWSNGERSKTTLSKAFCNEDSYKRYAEYQQSGKPYPVKIEAEAPADPEGASTLFRGDTASTDYALIDNMCKDFTNALRQYLSLEHATATIMQQADEATKAMSKDIPDLEGAELKL
jgi:hypothetical protein